MRNRSARRISPRVGATSPRSMRSRVVLPLPFGPTTPTRIPAETMKFNPSNNVRFPISQVTSWSSIRRLVFRSVAEKSICAVALRVLAFKSGKFADQFAGLVDAGLGFSSTRFCSPSEPLDLGVNQVFQSFLTLRLSMEEFFFLFQERAVVPVHAQQTVGITRDSVPPCRLQHSRESSGRGLPPHRRMAPAQVDLRATRFRRDPDDS